MLKTKSKFKLLLALGIMLLAMLLLGTTKANATSNILSNIPDSIEVNIPSTKYDQLVYGHQDFLNTIKSYITEDITDYTIECRAVTTSNVRLNDLSQIEIGLYKNYETVEKKTINIVYSDNNKRNDTDKNYVQNTATNLNFNVNYEFENVDVNKDEESLDIQLKKLFANTGLEYIETDIGAGESSVCSTYFSNELIITRNGVAYFSVICVLKGNMVITVPASIEDTDKAIIDYSSQIIKERMKNLEFEESDINSLTITKGTEQDKYIVNYTLFGNNETETIIIRKTKQEAVTVTDKTTNIKLDTNANIVPVNTILNSTEIKDEKTLNVVKESLKEFSNKYTTYDITLTSNGVKIQPNGKVKISIPIPTDYDKTKLAVYRVADNGEKTKYDVKVEGNYATFETDHFSTYVLAENNVTIANTNTNNNANKEKDNTPKTGKLDIINYVSFATTLAGVGIISIKRHFK